MSVIQSPVFDGTACTRSVRTPSVQIQRGVMALLCVLFLGTVLAFAARPADGASFAVLVPPTAGQAGLMRTIAQADGQLVRQSRYPWLAIAAPASGQTPTRFRAALHGAGAVLLLHPALLAGCFTPNVPSQNGT